MTRTVSVKQLGLITGGIALVLVVIWYMALIQPQGHKLKKAQAAEKVNQTQIVALNQQLQQLQSLVKEIPADKAKLAIYQQAIPSAPQLSTAIRSIQSAASAAGVTMAQLAPVKPTTGAASTGAVAGAEAIPVAMSASGNYGQIVAFMKDLVAMPRTLVIQSVALSGVGSQMTVSLTSDIYFTGSPTNP